MALTLEAARLLRQQGRVDPYDNNRLLAEISHAADRAEFAPDNQMLSSAFQRPAPPSWRQNLAQMLAMQGRR